MRTWRNALWNWLQPVAIQQSVAVSQPVSRKEEGHYFELSLIKHHPDRVPERVNRSEFQIPKGMDVLDMVAVFRLIEMEIVNRLQKS